MSNRPENNSPGKPQPLFTADFLRVLPIHFLVMGSFGIYFFLPQFIRLTGGEEFLIGLTMGAPAFTSLLLRLPAGNWIDRYGRRRMVILGLALFTVSTFLPVLAGGAGLFLLFARGLLGVAMVVYFTSLVTYVVEKAPSRRRAEAIAIYGAGGFIAQAISPYLCEWLLANLPFEPVSRFRILFALSGVLSGLALAAGLNMAEDHRRCAQDMLPDPWYRVIRKPSMIFLMLPSLAFGAGYTAIFSFVADFTQVNALGAPSNFFISYSVVIIILRLFTGRVLDTVDRRIGVIVSLLMMGCGLAYASFCSGRLDLIAVGILTGTGHCYIFPTLSTLTFDSSEPRNRGISMALYMLGFDLSTMLASPILGKIAERWDYFTMYRVAAFFLLAGILAYAAGLHHHTPGALERSADDSDRYIKNAGAVR
ncbi:MAG: MFS transporter [Candidatus Glassbacteria bacterium]|nr:MFS transporter [Candidatus Glassbacteria bacterium]